MSQKKCISCFLFISNLDIWKWTKSCISSTIKSKEEQDVIRQGARIADMGGYAALDALWDGAPEYVMTNAATEAMVKEIAKTYPQSELRDSKSIR